jgi:hypothetical protein
MKKEVLLTLALLGLTGCAYISGWWDDHVIPPIPTPIPGPVTNVPSADGFVFGQWEVLPGESMALSPQAVQAPLAQLASFTVTGHSASLTYGPDALSGQWWPHNGVLYGPYAIVYKADGAWWFGHVGWFVADGRTRLTDFAVAFSTSGTPFAAHPFVRGCDAYVIVYAGTGGPRSNAVKVTWE